MPSFAGRPHREDEDFDHNDDVYDDVADYEDEQGDNHHIDNSRRMGPHVTVADCPAISFVFVS